MESCTVPRQFHINKYNNKTRRAMAVNYSTLEKRETKLDQLEKRVNSTTFYSVVFYVLVVASCFSFVAKSVANSSEEHVTKTFVFIVCAIYFAFLALFVVELLLRVTVLRVTGFFWRRGRLQLANIFDLIIVLLEFLTTLFAMLKGSKIRNRSVSSGFGSLLPLRFIVYISYHPQVRRIISGLKQGAKSVIMMVVLLYIGTYGFAVCTFFIFSPDGFFGSFMTKNCTACADRFPTLTRSLFTCFEIFNAGGFDVISKIAKEIGGGLDFLIYAYFTLYIITTSFILLDIITSVIFDAYSRDRRYRTGEPHHTTMSHLLRDAFHVGSYIANHNRYSADDVVELYEITNHTETLDVTELRVELPLQKQHVVHSVFILYVKLIDEQYERVILLKGNKVSSDAMYKAGKLVQILHNKHQIHTVDCDVVLDDSEDNDPNNEDYSFFWSLVVAKP